MVGCKKRSAPSSNVPGVTPQSNKKSPKTPKVEREEDLDSTPGAGTSQSIAALFKKEHLSSVFGTPLTEDEQRKIEKEMEEFGLPKLVSTSRKKLVKTMEKNKNPSFKNQTLINKKSNKSDVFEEAQKIFREAERLLSGIDDFEEILLDDSEDTPTQKREVIELDIDTESDDDTQSQGTQIVETSDGEEEDMGVMKMFKIAFYGANFIELQLRAYDMDSISTVREQVAKKANIAQAENIQLFLDSSILEDSQNVKESGIFTGCILDGFIVEKSLQDIHETGSGAVLKLKLQTDDRRGRQNRQIYIRKTETIKILRNRYAQDVNMVPDTLKLMSEGEILDLESTVEECDLEDEYLVDVIISPT